MTSYVPPIKNGAGGWIGYVSLAPRTANGQWQSNPTLASGDVKISIDGGSLTNLTTLPAVTPASSKLVKITLSQAETNGDNLTIIFSDASGAEWCDLTINLQTVARQIDDLAYPATSGRSITVDASGNANANLVNIAGSAVSTSTAQLGVNVVQAGATTWSSGAITAASIASNAITAAKVATDAIGAAQLAADAVAEIADGVWDEARSGHTTSGTYGESHQVLKDTMEFHRGHHTATGSVFYVDGTAGNDITGNGSRALPYKTISKALSVCTSNNHDEIRLLPNSGGGPTTITESASISVTKNYVQIRGPGRDVKVTLNTSGPVFDISANGVQLSGMRIVTFSGASSDGVNINSAADFVSISRCFIEDSHRDGVQLNVANNCFVEDCQITNAGRDAIRVSSGSGSGNYNKILRNVIRGATANGVNLAGSDASNCRIQHNLVRDCLTGITIASGVANTSVTDNRFAGNTANFSDSGTTTQHEWNRLDTSITDGSVLVGSMNADTLTASALATDAVTEIQTGLATSSSLSTVNTNVSAIKAKTDSLAFTVAGQVDANIKSVADTTVTGSGTGADPWGP